MTGNAMNSSTISRQCMMEAEGDYRIAKRGLPLQGEAGGKNASFFNGSSPIPAIDLEIIRGVLLKVLAGIFLGFLLFGVVAARAEDGKMPVTVPKAPEFVPIVVDQAQYQAVMQHLNGMRFGDALPLVKWLNELEDRAKGQWEADHGAKDAEVPK